MSKRKIIKIDESKCNGCGLCVPNCAEGAIKIIDGKARLVSDVLCDGLGACLGHCPEGAISIEEREAGAFDEKAVHAAKVGHFHEHGGCPGSRVMDLSKKARSGRNEKSSGPHDSELRQWPVQIKLVSPDAPYFNNADLLIAADCVPFAYADFHENLLKGKILLVGCPKLDDIGYYKEKLSEIISNNNIRSVAYAHMEVPCCFGFVPAIKDAIKSSGKNIPFEDITITIDGERK